MRFLLLLTILILMPALAAAQPGGEDTADLYALWRDRVVQVQVIDRDSQSRAGLGSGYFAGRPGWVVTNYHVIADLANHPDRYEARFRSETGREGRLELLSVDVIHDLAVLRADDFAPPPLLLTGKGPRKGTRLYSMGYPYDIGLTIVEGTYNGMMAKSLYDRLHFTGSINPGMSGGPALDARGAVVGTNVATAGNQVSFLVPARFVAALLERTSEPRPATESLFESITEQLAANQAAIAGPLLREALPTTQLNGYRVPGALADFVDCWGNRSEEREDELDHVYYRCQSQDDIFLSDSLTTGVIRYQHDLLSTDHLHPLRFYRQLQERGHYPQLRLDGDETNVTNYHCSTEFVDGSGLEFRATFCVRGYHRFAGLYDAYLAVTSLAGDQEALQSTLVLAGFEWDNLSRLSARFIESLGWGKTP